jgi:diguanylate cyclase (GGDEF)-like protein
MDVLNRMNLFVPLIYQLAALPYALLGLYAWRRRHSAAVAPFAWAMLGLSVWAFAYSLEIFFPSLEAKLFFVGVEYIGIAATPVFMLFFAVEFVGRSRLLTPWIKAIVWALPAAAFVLAWTNPLHRLMWDMESVVETHGLTLLHVRYGNFFWVHIFYSYGVLLLASVLLGLEMFQRTGVYRIQIGFVILSILAPLIGGLIYLSGSSPVVDLDVTPLFFLPTALGLFWAIFKYRLLELLPPEHLAVLQNLKDGVIVLDSLHRVLYLNPVMEKLMRRSEDQVVGQPLAEAAEILAEKLSPLLDGGEHQVEITLETRTYEATASPLGHHNRPVSSASNRMVSLHDVSPRKEAEQALVRREAIMSAINFAAERFLMETRWEHHIPAVLERIGRAADVSRVFVVMNYADAEGVVYSSLCYEWAAPDVSPHINDPALRHVPLRKSGFGRWEENLSQGIPIHVAVRNLPEQEQEFLRRLGSVSIAAIPIFVENRWWGFIMLDECRRERQWNRMELEAFVAAANIFGTAETRARTEQKLIRRQRALSLLHDIVGISLQAGSLAHMAREVVERVGELIKADGCFMTLWSEEEKRPVPLAAYGPLQAVYETLTVQPGERTFTESALQLGHTLIVEDTRSTPHAERRIVENFPSQSMIVLPLIAQDKKLGALLLAFDTLHRFSSEEISISEQASALIALALEKFQAVEEAKQRADVSETLRKATAAISETLETDKTVARILEQLKQVIPYDSASVEILIEDELVIVGGNGFEDSRSIIGLRFPIAEEPNRTVMANGKPLYIPDTHNTPIGFNDIANLHIRSWLGVPLVVGEKIIGLLTVDSFNQNYFKEKDIQIAVEFATQVAVALENARIFEKAQSQAITDALTGVYNRRGLFQLGEFEFQRARRTGRPFCAMMMDIDHFKRVNDRHGHAAGDQILLKLAERCRRNSRPIDLIGRYGGEEFVILLPETQLADACLIAERLRLSIVNEAFKTDAGDLRITISIGVAEMSLSDPSLHVLIGRADSALYDAKGAGRNRVAARKADQ